MCVEAAVVCVARQAGTANAFAPVVEQLRTSGVPVRGIAFSPAWEALKRHGVDVHRVESASEGLAWLEALDRSGFLLAGTSEHASEDAVFWNWARRRGVPHVAFVDSWVNYWQRFTSEGGERFNLLPEAVAVVDRLAAERMIEAGCPHEAIVVLGNPAFDPWLRWPPARHREWRRQLRAGTQRRVAVFTLEPVAGADDAAFPGYTEDDALACALAALSAFANAEGSRWQVLIKPHPRQTADEASTIVDRCADPAPSGLNLQIAGTEDRRQLVAIADLVLGITSMFLLEASLTGTPVISIQPGRRRGCDLTDRPGITVATSREQVSRALRALLPGGVGTAPVPPSTRPAADLFIEYIGRRRLVFPL